MSEQVVIEFIADTSKLEEAYNKLNAQITDASSLNKDSATSFQKANADAASSFNAVTDATKQLNDQLRNLTSIVAGGVLKNIVTDLESIQKAQKQNGDSTKTLALQLAGAKEEYLRMAEAGLKGAKVFAEQRKEVDRLIQANQQLHLEVDKVNNAVKFFTGLSGIGNSISQGFEGAASAAKSFGIKNEELEKTVMRLQNAMKMLNGAIEAGKSIQNDSPLMSGLLATKTEAYGFAVSAVTKLEKAFGIESATAWGIATGGVSLLVTGIGYLIAKYEALESSEEKAIKRQERLKQSYDDSMVYFKDRNDLINKATELTLADMDREIVKAKENGASEKQLEELERNRALAKIDGVNKLYLANQQLVGELRNQETRKARLLKLERDEFELASIQLMTQQQYYDKYKFRYDDEEKGQAATIKNLKEIIAGEKDRLELGMAIIRQQNEAYIELHNLKPNQSVQNKAPDQVPLQAQIKQPAKINIDDISIEPKTIDDAVSKLLQSGVKTEDGIKLLKAFGFDSTAIAKILADSVTQAQQDTADILGQKLPTTDAENLNRYDAAKAKDVDQSRLQAMQQFNLSREQIDNDYSAFVDETGESDYKKFVQWEQKKADAHKAQQQQIAQLSINFAKQAADQIFAVTNQNRNQRFNDEVNTLQKQKDFELNNNNLTQAQKLAIQRKFDKEVAAVKLQQWKADQKSKEEQAIINGALAITNALVTAPTILAGLPLAAMAAATAAVQVATIAAQKPPQFAKGTPTGSPNTPAGTKLVGEHGPELIYTPGGERIITAPDTAAILAKYDVPALPNLSPQIMLKANAPYAAPLINEKSLARHLATEMAKQTRPIIQFDKNGFTTHLISKGSKTTLVNNKYQL